MSSEICAVPSFNSPPGELEHTDTLQMVGLKRHTHTLICGRRMENKFNVRNSAVASAFSKYRCFFSRWKFGVSEAKMLRQEGPKMEFTLNRVSKSTEMTRYSINFFAFLWTRIRGLETLSNRSRAFKFIIKKSYVSIATVPNFNLTKECFHLVFLLH